MAEPGADILTLVREAAAKRILFLPHALNQMNYPDRMISTAEVRNTVFHGEVIEEYPEDVRGHSCLLLGEGGDERPIHVVCAPKADYLAIITAYLPDPAKWEADWRTRKEKE
jgi:hypothetical protein